MSLNRLFPAVFLASQLAMVSAHAELRCADPVATELVNRLELKLKHGKQQIINDQNSLRDFQQIADDLNQFSDGSVSSALRTVLKGTFIFASDETKETVRRFFGDRLKVKGDIDFTAQLSTAVADIKVFSPTEGKAALDAIESSEATQRELLEQLTKSRNQQLQREIEKELQAVLEKAPVKSTIEKFGQVSKDIASMEVNLGRSKALITISKNRVAQLEKLSEQMRPICATSFERSVRKPKRNQMILESAVQEFNLDADRETSVLDLELDHAEPGLVGS